MGAAAVTILLIVLVCYVAYKLMARKHADAIKRVLHKMRAAVIQTKSQRRRRQRRQKRRRRRKRRGLWKKRHGVPTRPHSLDTQKDDDDDAGDIGFVGRWAIVVQATAVQVVHGTVKSATVKIFEHSEVIRIAINACKVITHLNGTLTWCFSLPKAMDELLALAAVFALDLWETTRMPCLITDIDYFFRIRVAIVAPVAVCGACVVGGVLWAWWHRSKRRRHKIQLSNTTVKIQRARKPRKHFENGALEFCQRDALLHRLDLPRRFAHFVADVFMP